MQAFQSFSKQGKQYVKGYGLSLSQSNEGRHNKSGHDSNCCTEECYGVRCNGWLQFFCMSAEEKLNPHIRKLGLTCPLW